MSLTGFDDLLGVGPSAEGKPLATTYQVVGAPVSAADIRNKLIPHLYNDLSGGDDAAVERAIGSAQIHIGTVFARLGRPLNLDLPIDREVLVRWTCYEMFLRVGHEAAGREYRISAKDLVIANYGSWPDNDLPQQGAVPVVAVTKVKPRRWP
jgi:hypothetical protein